MIESASWSHAGQAHHGERLFEELAKLELHKGTIDQIVVGLGPGSYSGVRIAITTGYAIAAAQGSVVVGISSAHAIAAQHPEASRLGVFSSARRGFCYVTVFECGRLLKETYLIKEEQVEDEASKMTLAVASAPVLSIDVVQTPRAEKLLEVPASASGWKNAELEPIYLEAN